MGAWAAVKEWFGYGAPYAVPSASGAQLVSPWETSNAAMIAWRDHFTPDESLITREAAMQVPSIARSRALLIGAIADLPLTVYRGGTALDRQPSWTHRSDGPLSIWHRMAAVVDDLLFYGASLLARRNGADGFPIDLVRVPRSRWDVDSQGRIVVDGTPAPADEVIIIPGPGEGLLVTAVGTIRGARGLDKAWQARVRTPIPATLFQQTEKETASQGEVQALLNGWAAQRRDPDSGGVGFVPYGITPVFPGLEASGTQDLFIQGRNAVRLDIANLVNIPASLLDGSLATASLTYQTAEGQRSSFHEQTMRYWLSPIEHRLSMDDVTPQGQTVRFDLNYLHHSPPSPQTPAGNAVEDIRMPSRVEAEEEGLV